MERIDSLVLPLLAVAGCWAFIGYERWRRRQLVEQAVVDRTSTISEELTKTQSLLDSMRRLARISEQELIDCKAARVRDADEIARLKQKINRAGMDSL